MSPPCPLRRALLAPLFAVVALALVLASPALLLLTALVSPLLSRRQWRPVRGLAFVLAYLGVETWTLLGLLVSWLSALPRGGVRSPAAQERYYAWMRRLLDLLAAVADRLLHVRATVTADSDDLGAATGRPVIVLSRHAGPGDSFLLVHLLLSRFARRPRIVMKEALALDPCVDVLGHRLPNAFLPAHAEPATRQSLVRRLVVGMDGRDALLLFPEGGNFTEDRRRRRIALLLRRGDRRAARTAMTMPNVVFPRTGGTLAALAACPAADVVVVGHTGLAGLGEAGHGVWRRLPMDQTMRTRLWHVPREQVPEGDEAREAWLAEWWQRVDDWVGEACGPPPEPARLLP